MKKIHLGKNTCVLVAIKTEAERVLLCQKVIGINKLENAFVRFVSIFLIHFKARREHQKDTLPKSNQGKRSNQRCLSTFESLEELQIVG